MSGKNLIMWYGISNNELAELWPCATERLHRISLYVEERLIYGCSSDKTEISDANLVRSIGNITDSWRKISRLIWPYKHTTTCNIGRFYETKERDLDDQIVADETVEFFRDISKILFNLVL